MSLFLAAALAASLTQPADILRANDNATGGSAWSGRQTLKIEYAYSGQGLTGWVRSFDDLTRIRFVDSYGIGPDAGWSGYDGARAWTKDSSGASTWQDGGDTPALSVNEGYRAANLWWRKDYGGAVVTFKGTEAENDATYDVLTFVPKGGKTFDAWFDTKTWLLARIVEVAGSQTITTRYSDYRSIDGAKVPGKVLIDDGSGEKYAQTLTLTKAEFLPAQSDGAFAKPESTMHDYAIAGGGAETTVPFRLMNNHVYADISVNGKGPFLFIFDTGGHNILMPATAKQLGLKPVGQQEGGGAGESVIDTGETFVDTIQVGGATLTHQLVTVLDFEKPETAGHETHGMIGFQTFRRFVTRFDYGARTITLIDPRHFDPKDAGVAVPFTLDGHIPVVDGTFEGTPCKFEIDTGSRSELTLTKPFAEQQNLRATHPKGGDAVEGWGVGGPTHAFVTLGKTMTIGPERIDNVVTSFSTDRKGAFVNGSYQGNVGSAILKRFAVTFDYEHQVMYLKRLPEPVADTGVFDRSGMWINQSPSGFVIVDVTKGAPADLAGLRVGDEITAVDGKTAAALNLSDLRQRLRDDPPGTAVTFTIKSGKDAKVTLRDLF